VFVRKGGKEGGRECRISAEGKGGKCREKGWLEAWRKRTRNTKEEAGKREQRGGRRKRKGNKQEKTYLTVESRDRKEKQGEKRKKKLK